MKKPEDLDAYLEWAKNTISADFGASASGSLYKINISAAFTKISESDFWHRLDARLASMADEYKQMRSAALFLGGLARPTLLKKPYDSLIDKSYRHNVVWNGHWPHQPKGGWLTPASAYTVADDLLRTTIVCTFIDGPEFITTDLGLLCDQLSLQSEKRMLSRNDGYYAHHMYIPFEVEIADSGGGIATHTVRLEIQVKTQLQQLLYELTHPFYKEERSLLRKDENWQWNYRTNKFRARYLSHTLHLLEALVLEVRDNAGK